MDGKPVPLPPAASSATSTAVSLAWSSARSLTVAAALALSLGGCFASVSVGSGGIGIGAGGGGVTIGAGRDGVTIGAGAGGGSVGVKIGGGGGSAPTRRLPEPAGHASRSGLLAKPVASGRLTSGFGVRHGRRHNGVDYAAPTGTPVQAAGDGVVEELRYSASYGNYLRIRHAEGLATAYAHLSGFAPGLRKGSSVRRGQTIGGVGRTGRASGPHLHYEMISGGVFVDPLGTS